MHALNLPALVYCRTKSLAYITRRVSVLRGGALAASRRLLRENQQVYLDVAVATDSVEVNNQKLSVNLCTGSPFQMFNSCTHCFE